LTNVGQIMRHLFEQHTVHFHGYPNASSYYDGVPDASIAINIGGSFSYYYLAPDAGTTLALPISPPEHLQMGMVGHSTWAGRTGGCRGRPLRVTAIGSRTTCARMRDRHPVLDTAAATNA